jgi:hypothetical protein
MSGLSLYQLAHGLERVNEILESAELGAEELELASQIADEILSGLLPEKVRDYCALMRSLRLTAEAFKCEEERIGKRRKALEALEQRLRERLKTGLALANIERLDAGTFAVRLQRTAPVVVVDDELVIPDDYWETRRTLDKRLVASALKAGAEVDGCRLVENKALVIR